MSEDVQTPAEETPPVEAPKPAAEPVAKAAAKKPAAKKAAEPARVPPALPRDLELLRGEPMPVRTYEDALKHFRRPFAANAVKWKVQTEWGDGALIVAYIDARLVYERINLVYPWVDEEKVPQGSGLMRCNLLVKDPVDPMRVIVRKTDVGTGGDPKTCESDAIKRTAVHLGIGVSIYALAQVRLAVGSGDAELRTEMRNKKQRDGSKKRVAVPILDKRTTDWLTAKYVLWLTWKGEPQFGPALDHGDDADAQGLDLDAPAAAAAVEGGEAQEDEPEKVAEQISGDRADELRGICEGLYGQFRKVAPKKVKNYPPAAFQAKLIEAGSTSLEALEALQGELEDLVRSNGGDA